MKKLLALILVLTLVLSMGSLAFATQEPEPDPDSEYVDGSPVKIDKNIKLGNEGTLKPAETFKFTVGDGEVLDGNAENAPEFDPDTFSIDIAQGELTGSANIILPTFDHVGEYVYEVKEAAGDTAGFVYDGVTYYLKITVINNDEGDGFIRVLTLYDGKDVKVDAFENEFYAGSLVIKKEITGNNAVYTDEFEVTVVLTPDEDKVIKQGPIAVSGAVDDIGNVADPNDDGEVIITFKVTNDSTVTIANIPYDVSYAVTEASGAYTATITDNDDGEIDAASQSVDIVNKLDTEINTGINLDNLPYILILVGAAVGLVAFTMKRRLSDDR